MSEYGLYIRFVSLSSAGQRRCCTASLNACGQFSSRRSGTRLANTTALQTGNGRRAHQRWSVEICPWRMLLSRTLSAEISLIGRATSISFFAFRYSSYSFFLLCNHSGALHTCSFVLSINCLPFSVIKTLGLYRSAWAERS